MEMALTKTEMHIDNGGLQIVRSQREVTLQVWEMIMKIAPVMHQSRMFGVTSPEGAAAIMLKGYELGLGITASFEFIQPIQGKPNLAPRGALALLYDHPEMKEIRVHKLEQGGKFIGYECYMQRRNGFSHTARFTLEDAQRAGLIKSDSGWTKYPENMCMWRAIGFAADVVASDITAGMTASMKMPEAFGMAITEAGEMIDITPTEQPKTAIQPPVEAITLEGLANKYGAEAIMIANEGKIPGSDEELAAVAKKLEGK